MAPTIRAATPEDLPQVRSLSEQWATGGETRGLEATPVESLSSLVGGCFFVAEEEGTVVGFAYGVAGSNDGSMSAVFETGATYVELEELYVVPASRSAGVGARLVDAVAAWARRNGIRYVSAYSATRDVDRVLRFYRSCGFENWSVQVFRDLAEPELANGSEDDRPDGGPTPSRA